MPLNVMFLQDDTIDCNPMEIKFKLRTEIDSSSSEDLKKAQIDQNVVFTKIQVLIEHIINNSIVYCIDDQEKINTVYEQLSNNFITLPSINDITLAAALHCKFNTMSTDSTYIHEIILTDLFNQIEISYFQVDEGFYEELPDVSDWNQALSYYPLAWWLRDDISTTDQIAKDQEELDAWNQTGVKENLIIETERIFNEITTQFQAIYNSDNTETSDQEGELVKVDFKSKLKLVD